jgi:hypothetical protein
MVRGLNRKETWMYDLAGPPPPEPPPPGDMGDARPFADYEAARRRALEALRAAKGLPPLADDGR